jgi:hypothetical protein
MAKYEDSPADKREDALGQKRMDRHVEVKGHKRRHPKFKPMPKQMPQEQLSSPMLATPPGGGNENFGDEGGFGGM